MGSARIVAFVPNPPDIPMLDTLQYVERGMTTAEDFQDLALELVEQIAEQMEDVEPPQIIAPVIDDIAYPGSYEPPVFTEEPEDITGLLPTEPGAPTIGSITFPTYGNAPDDDVSIPALDFGSKPSPFAGDLPQPGDLGPVAIPDSPTLTYPALPALPTVTIPDMAALDLPVFDDSIADAPVPSIPDYSFSESQYTSTLLSILDAKLQYWLGDNSTGISEGVEAAIWNRGRDREAATFNAAQDQVYRDFAARGFSLPGGAVASLVSKAREAFHAALSTFNRDVAIKQADLEQANVHFAMQQAKEIETVLIGYASQVAQRAFESAKYIVEAAIEVYKALVLSHNADVEAFKARAQVYAERIRGELAKVEVYKAQIEGQKLIAEIGDQAIRTYVAQLQGVEQMVKVYESQVRAASVAAEVNKNIIEVYKGRVQAYAEQVRAKALEYDGYETQVKAETAKLEGPKVLADVLKAKTDGYAARSRALTDQLNAAIKLQAEIPIEEYRARIQAFSATTQGVGEQIRGLANIYDSKVKAYSAQAGAKAAGASVDAAVINARGRIAEAQGNITVETARANVLGMLESSRMKIESSRAASAIMAQLAAGAMAGISVSASSSSSTGKSSSYSTTAANSASNSSSSSEIFTGKAD